MTRRLAIVALALSLGTLGAGSAPTPTEGRVVDTHGHLVRGATVRFVADPNGATSKMFFTQLLAFGRPNAPKPIEAKIGKDGRFHAALPAGELLVVVVRRGRTLGAAYLPGRRGPRVRIVLRRGPVIGGRVTRKDGTPVAGVEVAVASTFFRLPEVRTGRHGAFRTRVPFPSLPYLAQLSGAGIARARTELKAGRGNHLVVAPGRTVTGTVRYQGAPVAGATVTAKTRLVVTTTTDAKGHFALTGLRLHPFFHGADLVVRKGDEVGTTTVPAGAHPKPMVVDLAAPGGIEVKVVDLERRPIAGATVSANGETATTGEDGRATIPSTPLGEVQLHVVAAGYGESRTAVKVTKKGTIATVALKPGGALVVRAKGLSAESRKHGVVDVSRYVSDPNRSYKTSVHLDGKAAARIPHLADGTYIVWVAVPDQAMAPAVRVTVPRKTPVVIQMPKDESIAGRVVDGHGRGLSGFFVAAKRVYPWAKAKPLPSQMSFNALTDHHGRFRIHPVGPGAYTLTASGGLEYPKPAPVAVNAGDQKVVIRLHHAQPISGVVVRLDGKPVANAAVEANPQGKRKHERPVFDPRTARTDAHGRFEIKYLRPGPVRIQVTAGAQEQLSSRTFTVPAGSRDLTVVVGPKG